jgi:CheY-like chemotaxis protein
MANMFTPKYVVLYADDDKDDLELVIDALQEYSGNLEMITAPNGLEAIAYLKNLNPLDPAPCLIILDINMPKMNGVEALKNIRNMERFGDVPVVMFTTSSNPDDKVVAAQYGAGFITKPIDSSHLAAIAEQLISHCADETKKSMQRKQAK